MKDHVDEAVSRARGAAEVLMEGRDERGVGGFLAGMVLGALLGAGVALLLAPDTGKVTRRRLKRGFETVSGEARDQVGEWADEAKREVRRRSRRLRKHLPTS